MSIRSLFIMAIAVLSMNGHGQTIEIAYFKNNPGVQHQQIMKAAKDMQSTIQKWPGFISRELVYLEDNNWVDIVHWDNAQAAQKAVESAMQSPVCLTFFALIQSKPSDMQHGEIKLIQ
jgi:inorganic pyrophosphatase